MNNMQFNKSAGGTVRRACFACSISDEGLVADPDLDLPECIPLCQPADTLRTCISFLLFLRLCFHLLTV